MDGLGERLKILRGKTLQKKVADEIGVAQSTYTLYENGKREPGLDIIVKLAEYFDTSTDYLLGRAKWKEERDALAISEYGLTDEAAEKLRNLFNGEQYEQARGYAINLLLSSGKDTDLFLSSLAQYFAIDQNKRYSLTVADDEGGALSEPQDAYVMERAQLHSIDYAIRKIKRDAFPEHINGEED